MRTRCTVKNTSFSPTLIIVDEYILQLFHNNEFSPRYIIQTKYYFNLTNFTDKTHSMGHDETWLF